MTPALTPEGYARARRALMRRDPVLGWAIRRIGPCLMADRQRTDHLAALTGSIISQQLSTKAAATIYGRFVALFPGHVISGPEAIARLDDRVLRGSVRVGDQIHSCFVLYEKSVPSLAQQYAARVFGGCNGVLQQAIPLGIGKILPV